MYIFNLFEKGAAIVTMASILLKAFAMVSLLREAITPLSLNIREASELWRGSP
jgi:hypothetical protein